MSSAEMVEPTEAFMPDYWGLPVGDLQPAPPEVQSFLLREARMLDAKAWRDWADLFTEDGTYWVPATAGQADALYHVSHVYENRLLREVRIRRYANENAHSLQPAPRSLHIVGPAEVEDPAGDPVIVHATLLMVEYRRDEQTLLAGRTRHELVRSDSGFKIRQKRIELVNCEGMHGSVHSYL